MKKRKFSELRHSILNFLKKKKLSTLNNISRSTGINWKTVDNHLIYLIGKGFVKEVFSSPYVRIFKITEKGVKYLNKIKRGQK